MTELASQHDRLREKGHISMGNGLLACRNIIQKKTILFILLLGLINGLVYVFVSPPWEHYDEPSHFEYAWLIANRLKMPQIADYNQNMRLAVGKSILISRFFERRNVDLPNLTDPSKPIWIGVSQLNDPPLYYTLVAVPLYFLRESPVDFQLYCGRIVSLLFLLLTIYSSYLMAIELTTSDSALRWSLPLFIALLPGFVDLMTAMNDFSAAIGLFSLWLVISIKLINRGLSLRKVLFLILLSMACILTQKAVMSVLIFSPLVIILATLPKKKELVFWGCGIAVSILVILLLFNWTDAAYWIRSNYQDFPTRTSTKTFGDKQYALQGKVYPDFYWGSGYHAWNSGIFQLLPLQTGYQLKGKSVTIGAWVWADKTIQGYGPGLNLPSNGQDQWLGFKQTIISETPAFVTTVVQLPDEYGLIQIWLRTTSQETLNAKIFYSGVVMAEGEWPVQAPPEFSDNNGSKGIWGNRQFINLVRNAQFNQSWPYIKPVIYNFLAKKISGLTPISVSSAISLFLDPDSTGWYIQTTSATLFRTFWAGFSWGQVPLIGSGIFARPYRILLFFTLLGMIGFLFEIGTLIKNKTNVFYFLQFVMLITVVVAYLYGIYTMGGALRYRAYLPVARYIYPAIIPISFILVLGWNKLAILVTKHTKLPLKFGSIAYIVLLSTLDIYSIFSILSYFHPGTLG